MKLNLKIKNMTRIYVILKLIHQDHTTSRKNLDFFTFFNQRITVGVYRAKTMVFQ